MFGGGGISNKTSRLYERMVEEKEVAVDVHGGLPATIDPYLYSINFIVHPNSTSNKAVKIIDDTILDKAVISSARKLNRAARVTCR